MARTSNKGRLWGLWGAAALILCLFATTLSPAADASESVPVVGIDITRPEAEITDPAAGLQVLDQTCEAGQVDVNTASADDIAAAFGIKSRSTVRRIIDQRPWLKSDDLISVPGVGRSKSELVATSGCASATERLGDDSMACTSTGQVDLATASIAELVGDLGLSKVAARDIVANRPIPQDLTQITAPRTRGLGTGTLKKLLRKDAVCVTPTPRQFGGTAFRYLYPDHGAVVSPLGHNDYALIVPPGAMATPGWIEITPILGQDLDTAEIHTETPLVDFAAVRLPDPELGEPVIFHEASDGLRYSYGAGVFAEPGGTIVGLVKSTSEVSSASIDIACESGLSYSVFCQSQPSAVDLLLADSYRADAASMVENVSAVQSQYPDSGGECIESLQLLDSAGSVPRGIVCSAQISDDQLSSTWTFENVLAADYLLVESKSVPYWVDVAEGAQPYRTTTSTPGEVNNGWISGPIGQWLASIGYVIPGHAVEFTKRAGASATTVDVEGVSAGEVALIYAVLNIVETVDTLNEFSGLFENVPFFDVITGCFGTVADGFDVNGVDLLGCIYAAVDLQLSVVVAVIDKGEPAARKIKNVRGVLKKLALAPILFEFVLELTTNLLDGSVLNEQSLTFVHYRPPAPPQPSFDAQGRSVFDHCAVSRFRVGQGWEWRISTTCQDYAHGDVVAAPTPPAGPIVDAFDDWVGEITSLRMHNLLRRDAAGVLHLILLEGGELVAHPIAAEDEWDFKRDWPEDEWRSEEFAGLIDRVGEQAVNDPLRLRNFAQGRGHSWLMRIPDGRAWLIQPNGERVPLDRDVEQQQRASVGVLTLHPANWANDICPYPRDIDDGVRVCGPNPPD